MIPDVNFGVEDWYQLVEELVMHRGVHDVCVCVCVRACVRIYVHICTYIHKCIHTHTCIGRHDEGSADWSHLSAEEWHDLLEQVRPMPASMYVYMVNIHSHICA